MKENQKNSISFQAEVEMVVSRPVFLDNNK